MQLKTLYTKFKREIKVYKLVVEDKRTPLLGKIILSLAIGYLFFSFDLIPDFIPILGQLDELVVIPFLIYIALKIIPKEIVIEARVRIR